MTVILALPLILVRHLPLADLPVHQARLWLLSSLADDPALERFFRIDWRPAPVLALDLTIPSLARFFGTEAAVRVFLVAIIVLLAFGSVCFHRVITVRIGAPRQRWSPWPLVGLLLVYNKIFTFGS